MHLLNGELTQLLTPGRPLQDNEYFISQPTHSINIFSFSFINLGKPASAKRIVITHRHLIIFNDKSDENQNDPAVISRKISLKKAFARIRKTKVIH